MSENYKNQNQFNIHGNIGNINAGDTTINGDQIGMQNNYASDKSLAESTDEKSTQTQKILILAAIPHNSRLDREIRSIEECIRRAVRRDMFKVEIKTAVRSQDIRRAIAEQKPQVVHFCGHGLEDGSLLLEDDGGNEKPVLASGLAALFELHADYVKCVVLNACYSIKAAEAISQHINYAIGMNQPIQDTSAIEFAQGFYDGLGYDSQKQDMFQRAFQEGKIAIQLDNFSQAEIPVMKVRY
ncbi:MAG: CHAT domain-containing protein [Cyanobacteria bacterium P01_C01_bin.38]